MNINNLSRHTGLAIVLAIAIILVQVFLYARVKSEEAEEMKKREDPTYSEEDKEKKEKDLLLKKTGCMIFMTAILWGYFRFTNKLSDSFGNWAFLPPVAISIVTIIAAATTGFAAFSLGGSAKLGAPMIMSSQGLDKFNTACVIISILMVCLTIGFDFNTVKSSSAINKQAQPAVAQPAVAQPAVQKAATGGMFGKKLLNFGKRKLK